MSTSSRSSVEEYEESRVVRSRSPSRSPTRKVQRQMFFGDDYADTDSDCPMKEVDFHSDVVKPSSTADFVRTTTTTTKTVVCEEQMHLESDVETNTSSVAMDNAWEVSTADMKRRSTADSAPSSDFSTSPCERKKSRHHAHYARPTFSSALAQSTGMSDTLARMKLRKQEVEMANVVDKVQKQMIAMESMLKELQLEHRVKCELLERQIEHTNRVEAEKTALQRELDDATRQLVALQSHKEGETTQNVNYLSVAMTAFMNQSEQAQNMMLNQLKALDLPQPSSQVKENNADVLQQLTKYHQDVLAALQSTAAPVKVAEPATLVRRSNTLATEAPAAKAMPESIAPAYSPGLTSQRLIGVLIFCLGVGGGLLAQSSMDNQSSPAPAVQAPMDVDAIVEKLKQAYTPVHAAPTESKWVEVVAPVEPIEASAKAAEPVVDVPAVIEPVELVEDAKPEVAKEDVPSKEVVSAQPSSSAIVPDDASGQIALMMKLRNLKKHVKVEKPAPVDIVEVEVEPLLNLPVALAEPALNASNVVLTDKSDDGEIDEPVAELTASTDVTEVAPVDVATAEVAVVAPVDVASAEVANATEDAAEPLLLVKEDAIDDVVAVENSTESTVSEVVATVAEVVTVELNATGAVEDSEVFAEVFSASQSIPEEETVEAELVHDDVESVEVSDVVEPLVEPASVALLPTSSFDALAMALRSLINPSHKEAAVAVPTLQPKATLATLPSKSSSRRLWKREVKATAIISKLPSEDVKIAAVSFDAEQSVESLENATSPVSDDAKSVVPAEVNATHSAKAAAALSWESTSKENWADKVYANMSTEVAAVSIPTEVPAAIEAALSKPSLFALRSKLILPTCAWNTSIAVEVSWNPSYNPKAIASIVDPIVALDATADATEASVADAVDESAVVVAEAPLEDARVATTADELEQATENADAVKVAQADSNTANADVEQAKGVTVSLKIADVAVVEQAVEKVAPVEVAETENNANTEVVEVIDAVELTEVAAVAEEVDAVESDALQVEEVEDGIEVADAVEPVEIAPDAFEPEVAEHEAAATDELDAVVVDEVAAEGEVQAFVGAFEAPVESQVVLEPAAEETHVAEDAAELEAQPVADAVVTDEAQEAVDAVADAVDVVEDVTSIEEPEEAAEESVVDHSQVIVEAMAEMEAQVPAALALPALVEVDVDTVAAPEVEADAEHVEEIAEEFAVESHVVATVELDETAVEAQVQVATSAEDDVTEPVVEPAPIAEQGKEAIASVAQDPVSAFLAILASP